VKAQRLGPSRADYIRRVALDTELVLVTGDSDRAGGSARPSRQAL
jgi:hypothetical protein